MNYYIIIRGPLGVGKSTIAKALAKKLNAEHISIDKVLEENKLDKVKVKCIPLKNFIKANEIVLSKAKKYLDKKKIVIFDGCFYHKEQIKHLIRNLKYKYLVFTLKAKLEVCIKRDSKRKIKYGKEAAKAVHNLVSQFDYGTIINTENKSINEVVNEILTHI